jgi:hypothetical protein
LTATLNDEGIVARPSVEIQGAAGRAEVLKDDIRPEAGDDRCLIAQSGHRNRVVAARALDRQHIAAARAIDGDQLGMGEVHHRRGSGAGPRRLDAAAVARGAGQDQERVGGASRAQQHDGVNAGARTGRVAAVHVDGDAAVVAANDADDVAAAQALDV